MNSLLAQLPKPPPGRTGWPWSEETAPTVYSSRPSWPRISIVTPSYNQGVFLEETIRSILLQNYPALQLIIIDGGSTDGTVETLGKYAPWIHHWESERDRGQSHAINKGLAHCNGEWFNWLNSDDYLLPGALFELARSTPPETSIIAGRTSNLESGMITGTYACRWTGDMPASLFFLGVNQPGSLLRLDVVRAAGGVREDLRYTMDLDLWLRMILQEGPSCLANITAAVAVYRYHEQSKTCSGHDVFAAEELAVILDLFRSLTPMRALESLIPSRSEPPSYDPSRLPTWTFGVLKRALLDRLLVNDSLLFRGLWRQTSDAGRAISTFRAHLAKLNDDLIDTYGKQARIIRANALIRAMEAMNRLSPSAAIEALRLAPSMRVLRALTRLLLRHAKP